MLRAIQLVVGLLFTGLGLVGAFFGGYMMSGEAHSNRAEGMPMLLFGLGCVLAGLALVSWTAWKWLRRPRSSSREHDEPRTP